VTRPRTRRCAALACGALLGVALAGCIASNVVAPEQRLVVAEPQDQPWVPADAAAIPGFQESIDLRGDAAASLRRVWYVFAADGAYTGAALADVDGRLEFQTLAGTWALTPAGLVLDGRAAVRCEMAPGHLRLSADNGVVVLRRGTLQ
jgi:hypothetical protein